MGLWNRTNPIISQYLPHTNWDCPVSRLTPVPQGHWPVSETRAYFFLPQHCLYFFPLPQGQGSLRPTGAWGASGGDGGAPGSGTR